MALKKAESSDEVVLRMVEIDGKPAVERACPLRRSDRLGARSERPGIAGGIGDGAKRRAGDELHRLSAAHFCAEAWRGSGEGRGGYIEAGGACTTISPLPATTTRRPPAASTPRATRCPPRCCLPRWNSMAWSSILRRRARARPTPWSPRDRKSTCPPDATTASTCSPPPTDGDQQRAIPRR